MAVQQNIREIVLDTETTGLDFAAGDRIFEIACVELINHIATGNTYHVYINPEKEIDDEAAQVTGMTNEFLLDKPLFREIADEFLAFVNNDTLVIHNAKFDIGFLNGELGLIGKPGFNLEDAVDTLEIARRKFPGSPLSLDALCRRFDIDTSSRGKHGALIDSILLAEVYVNLLGGKQSGWSFESNENQQTTSQQFKRKVRVARKFSVPEDELKAHRDFIETLSNPMWNREWEKF
jgi:DNA polymerase-3 subunit epsilon